MDAPKARTVLEGLAVDGWPGVYVLGCIDRRVTVYSQQVRALNLAAALVASARVKAGERVVVVGAGAAGLTCAAGLRTLGAEVTVLEAREEILPLFRGGSTRWLHPGVYDWPLEGWDRDRAGLPLLDWAHGSVDDVRAQLEAGWAEVADGVTVRCGVREVRLGAMGDAPRSVTWSPGGRERAATVILAVGFGLEGTPLSTERRYWEGDDFDAPRVDGVARKWLVSGCGDGALTDLFRLCLREFRHDRMLEEFTSDPRTAGIRAEIRRIEEDAAIQDDPVKLHDAYAGLDAPWVVKAMQARGRTDTKVTLAAPTADFLTRGASPLNRFLAGQLHAAGSFALVLSKVASAKPEGAEVVVRFEDETSGSFDRIVRRHGPLAAVAESFPLIAKAIEVDRAQRRSKPTLTDQTRERFWDEGVFGPEVRGDMGEGAPPPKPAAVSVAHDEPTSDPEHESIRVPGKHARVFISYSDETDAHSQRVRALADRLREEGVDARLDKYDPHPPEGWPQWTKRQLMEVDAVLLVCTATYRRRYDREETLGVGQGVAWEGLIAEQVLYEAGGLNHKLIPVSFEGKLEDVPISLRAFTRYELPKEYDALYRRITGQPIPVPKLGSVRAMSPGASPAKSVPSTPGDQTREQLSIETPQGQAIAVDGPPPSDAGSSGLARVEHDSNVRRGTDYSQSSAGAIEPRCWNEPIQREDDSRTPNLAEASASVVSSTVGLSKQEQTDRDHPVPRRLVLRLSLFVVAILTVSTLYYIIAVPVKDCIPISNVACMDSLEVSRSEFEKFWSYQCPAGEAAPYCTKPYYHIDPENHENLYIKNEAARIEQNAQCTDDRWSDNHPIVCVSWYQASAYCRWVGGRLPSVDEWSIAAGSSKYPWGDEPPTLDRVNGCGSKCSDVELKGFPGRKRTPFPGDEKDVAAALVGSYPPTGAGFYDLAGNVWEWTSTRGQPQYPFPASLPDADPQHVGYLVVGGGWDTDRDRAHDFEADGRRAIPRFAIRRDNNLGFRCVRPLSTIE